MKLNYCAAGSGPALVLLHGVTRRWQSFLPVMAGLRAGWKVMAFDLPGHGDSSRLPRYHVTDYVPPLARFLRERVNEPVVIYGHSLGAMCAAALAAEAPDRVRAVVMEDPPFETMGSRIREGGLHAWFEALHPFAGAEGSVGEVTRQLGEATAAGVPLKQLRDAVALRFTASSLKKMDAAVLQPIVDGEWLTGYDTDEVLKAVHCPALLIQADPSTGAMLTDLDAARAAELIVS